MGQWSMDVLLITVIAVVASALLFDFTNGFHDAAISVATVVATRALPARWAPWFSAFFNFSAYFVGGTAVANTVAKVVHARNEHRPGLLGAHRRDRLELRDLVHRHAVVIEPRHHRRSSRFRAGHRGPGRHQLEGRVGGRGRDRRVPAGRPVSTTHAAASSVAGSSIRSGGGVNRKVVGEMVTAWLVTVPATVAISWVMYHLTQLPGIAAWAAVRSVLLVLGAGSRTR